MLILRDYQANEINKIKKILLDENINDFDFKDIIYVMLDNEDLIGVGKVEMFNENWLLKYLVIREDRRGENLGDGLLRALLSKLYNSGVKFLFYENTNPYLIKKGFAIDEENQLKINIVDFFKTGCKNCSGCNEL